MRERHETPLNPQQIEGIRDADKRQMGKHERQQHAMADHTLRVRCVEQAIKYVDSMPNITLSSAPNVTASCNLELSLAAISRSIYEFVNEPLDALKGDE